MISRLLNTRRRFCQRASSRSATAVGEAVWLAGFANVHPEHRRLGVQPHRVPYKFYTQRFDYELEWGIFICKQGADIPKEKAHEYIGGYTIFNDFSLAEDSYFRPPVTAKCLDGFGPAGPYIVDRKEITDPHNLAIRTYVNGVLKHTASTADMRLEIPAIIQALTEFMTLTPGTVVVSGFPHGRVAVKPGDEVKVEIEHIGFLINRIVTINNGQ